MEQTVGVPFPQVLGHAEIRQHLMGALVSGTISHAYLLEGMEGVGRRTMVRAFLQALLCTENGGRGEGCGRCTACRTVMDGNHPDVRWIDPEKGESTIRVQTIRTKLVQDMMIRPYQSAYKIYVIEQAELLGVEAQNAMLKTIEEPPSYGLIFLLSSGATTLLPTIQSRCVRLRFQPLSTELIRQELTRRGLSEKQVALGSAFAQGSLGRALRTAQDEDFMTLREEICGFLAQIPNHGSGWLLEQEALFEKYKKDIATVLDLMEIWYRDVLILQQTHEEGRLMTADYAEAIARTAERYTLRQLVAISEKVAQVRDQINQNANYSLAMDCLLLTIDRKNGGVH
jgi:DNA polymerase-3 subunit delta'